MFMLNYDFRPNDVVYITEEYSVQKGVVCQMKADVHLDADDNLVEDIEYLILLDSTNSTVIVNSDNVFATSADAFVVISEKLDPTP